MLASSSSDEVSWVKGVLVVLWVGVGCVLCKGGGLDRASINVQ